MEYEHEAGTEAHTHNATRTVIFRTSTGTVEMVINLSTRVDVNTSVTGSQSASADNLENAVDVPAGTTHGDHVIDVELKVEEAADSSDEAKQILKEFDAVTSDTGVSEGEKKLVIPDFIDATITKTEKINGEQQGETETIKNTRQLVSVYLPVPDDLMNLLKAHGLTTDYIRAYRHHVTDGDKTELEQLTRITEDNDTREGFYTITLTNQGETRDYVVIRAEKFSVYGLGVVLNALPETPVGPDQGGHGGHGGVTRYPVETETGDNGSVSVSHDRASAGTRVTVTVTPDEGYRLNSIVVTDSAGKRITVTASDDGTYTFTMPSRGVTVEVTFTLAIADPEDTGVSDWLNTEDHMAFMMGYDTGLFGPEENITRAQVAQMFYRLLRDQRVETTVTFSDVPENAWYAQAVNALASLGMVNGVGENRFEPERPITRAEFSAVAVRFADRMVESGVTFSDVPESHWAHDYIAAAAAFGWVNGVGGDRFDPQSNMTRAQAAAIVNRMTGRQADQAAIDRGEGTQFPDVSRNHWAWYDIGEAATAHDYSRDGGKETWQIR